MKAAGTAWGTAHERNGERCVNITGTRRERHGTFSRMERVRSGNGAGTGQERSGSGTGTNTARGRHENGKETV